MMSQQSSNTSLLSLLNTTFYQKNMRYKIYQLFIYHFEFVTNLLILLLISVQFYKYVHFYVHF